MALQVRESNPLVSGDAAHGKRAAQSPSCPWTGQSSGSEQVCWPEAGKAQGPASHPDTVGPPRLRQMLQEGACRQLGLPGTHRRAVTAITPALLPLGDPVPTACPGLGGPRGAAPAL